MKKIISLFLIICSVVLLASCNVGQSENESSVYKSYVTSVASDGLTPIEKDWREYISEIDESIAKQRIIKFDDIECSVEYQDSFMGRVGCIEYLRYENDDVEMYFEKDSGDLLYITWWSSMTGESYYQKDDIENPGEYAEALAKKIAEKYIDIEKYTLVSSQDERDLFSPAYKIFGFTYRKYIDGYPTNDVLKLRITSKGDVMSLEIADNCRYDNIDTDKINIEEVNKSVASKIEEMYGDKYTYSYNMYKDSGYIIGKTPDGEATIVTLYQVDLTTKEGVKFSTLAEITTCLGQTVKPSSNKSIEFQDVSSSN